nr:MAG: putative RNA dependent RNA polymerase [Sichuan mito-like virus 39]
MRTQWNKSTFIVTVRCKQILSTLNGAISRNRGRYLINFFLRSLSIVPIRRSKAWVRAIRQFSLVVYNLTRSNGKPFVAKWLKANAVLLQQSVGGHIHPATQDLGVAVSRTTRGLPRVIPREMRERIRRKERLVIIGWLTLFNLYRVLEFDGQLKLSTITQPGKIIQGEEIIGFRDFITDVFWPLVAKLFPTGLSLASKNKTPKGKSPLVNEWVVKNLQPSYFAISSSGTLGGGTISTHPRSLRASAIAWFKNPEMLDHLKEWIKALTPKPAYRRPEYPIEKFWKDLTKAASEKTLIQRTDRMEEIIPLGKLALKQESAGKVRVFAIVDNWTQWLLKPLHSALFTILRKIPTDGTFDQMAPVRRLKITRTSSVYSFDLSAATDRLPLQFQKIVLGPVLGIHLAETWGNLLTKRDYVLGKKNRARKYRYAVGQPMGALSSWAMLALTHHAIVQWAAFRSGVTSGTRWFMDYAILGDDVIITNPLVAKEYLKIMESLGVQVGLAKSLISHKGVGEFAKRYLIPSDASPISLKEVVCAQNSSSNLLEFAKKRRKIRLADILSFLGYGYRAIASSNKRYSKLPTRLRNWILTLTYPGQPFGKTMDDWLRSLSFDRISNRDLPGSYRTLVGIMTERLHNRLKSSKHFFERAWEVKMMKRNLSLGLPTPDWIRADPFLYEIWFSTQEGVAWEVSEIKLELQRIAKLKDPREAFIMLMKVEERMDLLVIPESYKERSSKETKFNLMSFLTHWYNVRRKASS